MLRSLVGSEMCIRDRRETARGTDDRRRAGADAAGGRGSAAVEEAAGRPPAGRRGRGGARRRAGLTTAGRAGRTTAGGDGEDAATMNWGFKH